MDADLISGRLLGGERVAWSGRPVQGILFTARDIFLIPFSLIWCGFAVFWEASVLAMSGAARGATGFSNVPSFMLLFGSVFVCVGLYFVFGRFLFDAWIRGGIRYAVTDQRILIARPGPFSSFTALYLDRLPDMQISERAGGRGTIRFGQRQSLFGYRNSAIWSPALDPTPQFLAIDDARRVFDLIQRQARPQN